LDWLTARETERLVREAVAEMAPQDREILLLKHAEGWSYREISELLGVTIDKVIYRLGRARRRLRQRLAPIDD
jgi:RNA polymerase sigma-70 factor (ECF subfamily)